NSLRALLVARLQSAGVDRDFSFIEQEKGMFSFLGVNKDQIQTLIQQYSIYLVGSSRINIASINDDNIDYLVESIKAVL
ncbi:MAG: aminotransferase class I/II-fold pyridoxal phosphate-dependent enzyme, partial [Pseudohongiellaceae bacterium]